MKKLCVLFFLFLAASLQAAPSEQIRKTYADQIQAAFQLQALGKSTLAFYAFADAYQFALKNGESPEKLAPFDTLFQWYRKHGYNCGVAAEPSRCIDEHLSPSGYKKPAPKSYGSNLDPRQEKLMRDFLFGVGQLVAGVFCAAVNPPIGGRFGTPLIVNGGRCLYESVSSMMQDSQEKKLRLEELNSIQNKMKVSTEH